MLVGCGRQVIHSVQDVLLTLASYHIFLGHLVLDTTPDIPLYHSILIFFSLSLSPSSLSLLLALSLSASLSLACSLSPSLSQSMDIGTYTLFQC